MSSLLVTLEKHAVDYSNSIAIKGNDATITYGDLPSELAKIQRLIKLQAHDRVGLLMDNTPAALLMDLACVSRSCVTVPLPLFFLPTQIKHALQDSGVTIIFSNLGEFSQQLLIQAQLAFEALDSMDVAGESLQVFRLLSVKPITIFPNIQKITYTSGSTGEPKGVCLTQLAIDSVACALLQATQADRHDRHLCLLPYATLLENIAGMYVPLLAGASIYLLGLAGVGMQGASQLDVSRFMQALYTSKATTCVMVPQMLQALLAAIDAGAERPKDLRFVAVGGAPVSECLLKQADAMGMPVYEGYGLSEACSVVTLNTFTSKRIGSVGKVLPHIDLKISDDGEVLVSGELFSGYLGDNEEATQPYATGDMGYLDDDGFLHLQGRKKHIFITSFGRNVSPEWVERELNIEHAIAQSCVFGEGKPFNMAVLCLREGFDKIALRKAIAGANSRLPDYAKVKHWIVANEAFSVENGLWTGTGRPRRMMIAKAYQEDIEKLYMEEA